MKAKSVAMMDGNKIVAKFSSIGDAARITDSDPSHIAKVTRGERMTANGAKWKEIKRFDSSKFTKNNKGLLQVEASNPENVVAVYPNVQTASKVTGLKDTKISDCLIGKAKKIKGFTWLSAA